MGHGNRWEEYYKMDRVAERAAIKSAVESITRTTGQRPLGWYCRHGASVNTRELVVEEGGFLYDCNSYNDDLPYYADVIGMLDAVYVETINEKSVVALKPKPAFQALFQLATTREGSGVALYPENEKAPELIGSSQNDSPWLWWRRGRVELGLNTYLGDSPSDRGLVRVELTVG